MLVLPVLLLPEQLHIEKIKFKQNSCTGITEKFFWFCLTSRSTIFQSCWDRATASWVFTSTLGSLNCLAKGHYTAVVGFESWTSRSGVRRSTSEPPQKWHALVFVLNVWKEVNFDNLFI